ncbi:MAG: Fur family transcriptional regulator [Gammaproteobacteria bacterium]|nr:MAG: Fur family transcriptional regulator [Gammaproteobacteria bacterium]
MITRKAQHSDALRAWLRDHGINPTNQRVEIARAFFARCVHLSAEDVFRAVNGDSHRVSKATVYNTLALYVEKGLVRQVVADPSKIFYDSNTGPHHHFYDIGSGELSDIDVGDVKVSGLPPLPAGTSLEGVDVVVRLRYDE